MAIIEKLVNIQENIKPQIKTSLENKGVTVADNYKLSDIPDMVDSISGGGGIEIGSITDCSYMFYTTTNISKTSNNGGRYELLKYVYKSLLPKSAQYMFAANSNLKVSSGFEDCLIHINDIDFSQCTNFDNFFSTTNNESTPEEIIINAPNATSFYSFVKGYAFTGNSKTKTIKLLNTSKVTNFAQCFYSGFSGSTDEKYNRQFERIELDMSACTSCTTFFNSTAQASNANMKHLQHFIINGSFGGNSTTSSLTLELQGIPSIGVDGFLELFNNIGVNTLSKTRIIKIPTIIYDTLTDDQIAIATSKGYTITK